MSEHLDTWIDYLNQGRAQGAVRFMVPAAAMESIVTKMKADEMLIAYLQGIIEGLRRGESGK